MKPRLLTLAVLAASVAATSAPAQDEPSGFDLIGEGAGQILQGLASEAAPAIDGLTQGLPEWGAEVVPTVTAIVSDLGPGFFDVFREVDSLANYEAPAIQPNGDILIRRSPDAPAWDPPAAEGAPEADAAPAP
jgi:hypothetical protein